MPPMACAAYAIIPCMKNLYRSADERLVAGVCAGIGRRFDLNVTGFRWTVALATLFLSGVPAIAYVILWAILKPRQTSDVIDV